MIMNHKSPTLFLLFSHTLTATQEADARLSLGVKRIIEPPISIRMIWAQVPPDVDELTGYLAPVFSWLAGEARPGPAISP